MTDNQQQPFSSSSSTRSVQKEILLLKRRLAVLEGVEAKRQKGGNRIEEALCLLQNEYLPFDKLLLEHFPDLIGNRDFWWAFLAIKDTLPPLPEVAFLLDREIPTPILEDKDLMVAICSYDPWVYESISSDSLLKNDSQIVETVLKGDTMFVLALSARVQLAHPFLVGTALARLPLYMKRLREDVKTSLADSLWSDRSVALGWAKGGGDFHERFPTSFKSDGELLLTFQGNVAVEFDRTPIPAQFRANKEYMMQAVERSPSCLSRVAASLVGEVDLLVAALSDIRSMAHFHADEDGLDPWIDHLFEDEDEDSVYSKGQHRCWFWVGKHVRARLHSHDIFVKLVLGSTGRQTEDDASNHTFASTSSPFALLSNQAAYMKPIAEYLGIPMGEELRRLRGARRTLALNGVCWNDPKC